MPTPTNELFDLRWYPVELMPWERMWPDDSIWLPLVLGRNFVTAHFVLGYNGVIADYQLEKYRI